jgi:hypothetical protein
LAFTNPEKMKSTPVKILDMWIAGFKLHQD